MLSYYITIKYQKSAVAGDQFVFSNKRYLEWSPATHRFFGGPELAIGSEIYFDYNGLLWTIKAYSFTEVAEQDKVHSEHMLETFKFLE